MFVYTKKGAFFMRVVTTRVDEKDARDLAEVERVEKVERAEAVRKLLARGLRDWKIEFALKKLRKREVSIAKAAEIAGVSFSDMLDLMEKENIDIGYGQKELLNDFATLQETFGKSFIKKPFAVAKALGK